MKSSPIKALKNKPGQGFFPPIAPLKVDLHRDNAVAAALLTPEH